MLDTRGIYSNVPPDIRTRVQDNPTLLVSWWATAFSLAIIVTRVCGRYIRIERFFPEDKVMMTSIIPLLIRMAFVHVILIWGTNNTKTDGLTAEEIRHREIGSKLVLAARIFYAIFIWTAKVTVCLFLKRVAGMIWRRSLQRFLQFLYYFLASTFIAVVIATLTECQPFNHYWQVVPDPGAQCRSGYANLITMGTCDVITDLLLVAFPIPLVLMTHMSVKRKASLVVLFALSLILVGITSYRIPTVISHGGSQQYRSLVASLEILAATAVSNALVIGSFVRDKGVKKVKYQKAVGSASVSESVEHSSIQRSHITHHQWGSDSDLAGGLGIRLAPELCSFDNTVPRPAPIAAPHHTFTAHTGNLTPNWSFNRNSMGAEDDAISTPDSLDVKVSPREYIETNKTPSKRPSNAMSHSSQRMSIFDVGGLLDSTPTASDSATHPHIPQDFEMSIRPPRRSGTRTFLQDVGGLLSVPGTQNRPALPPQPSHSNFSRPGILSLSGHTQTNTGRRGSSVHFSDETEAPVPSYRSHPDVSGPINEGNDMELQDVGGLLSRDT
ncbi:hypothetical protein ASPWEDRAFT_490157 [Aspergillus wentii DTO 134E9]|uniref:Rhodopsin domain-containing protein n=1 Tax=Aspergillus wentii DTO 134E9 TaxID=1073089 RepID=A0A1L9RJJ7_ASPWE|nr:uncharacterized protein ASPWEDRAFT_490157 [Aspergillus wentii DTO 134E9]KAI9931969.1 hypothetical protein MW887_009470 [Aspergillus wentii]OJJ35074.1 hypothetical protein ASPWEDRAFT_490157 [Aspergillus wentii DTO 134E9]